MIINPYLFNTINTFDDDAKAFFDATGITDSNQQNAINELVIDLKGFGLWAILKAIYPFVGHTPSTHKFNLKDPRNLDVAFRLSFHGGWNHSSTGATPNGINTYADTFYNLSLNSSNSNLSFGIYSRINSVLAGSELGALEGGFVGMQINLKNPDLNTYFCANNFASNGSGPFISDTRGFFVINKENINSQKMFRNGIEIRQSATTLNTAPNVNAVLGARRLTTTIQLYNSREHSFTFFGNTLTSTQITNLNTAVQKYQISLGRNV